jgi:proteasome accessory factor A
VFGIETEYGVLGDSRNAVELSSAVVAAYKRLTPELVAPWDFASEDPLNDSRGFRLDRAAAHPSQLTDRPTLAAGVNTPRGTEDRTGPGAAMLANGARLYVDHAHPEYATPEVTSAREAALWDRAGEWVMARASQALVEAGRKVSLYKNNTDGKGASYGTHENYLVPRSVPWELLTQFMMPFLVTRQIFTGSGRVGLGQRSEEAGFQLSQRADFVEAETGLETTLNRPIVNTRDEPHADPTSWRRLHVIVGDATMMDRATYLRLGTGALVLAALAAAPVSDAAQFASEVALRSPVETFAQVSRDLSVSEQLELTGGPPLRALDIQRLYLGFVNRHLDNLDCEWVDLADRWAEVLDLLAADPLSAGRQVEWVAKYSLLDGLRSRNQAGWDSPKLRAADLRWTDVDPAVGLFRKLEATGAVDSMFSEADVAWAVANPPESTRAYLKGQALRRFGTGVAAAGWDSLTLATPNGHRRLVLGEPLAGSRAQVEQAVGAASDAGELLDRLAELGVGRVAL